MHREQIGEIADEEDVRIARRLLEGFQKCVRGTFHETIRVENDDHFPSATQRAHLEGALEFAHLFDRDAARLGLRFGDVDIRVLQRIGGVANENAGEARGDFARAAADGAGD